MSGASPATGLARRAPKISCRGLEAALGVAVSSDQIWVARGVYYPDEGAGHSGNDLAETPADLAGGNRLRLVEFPLRK